MSSPTLLWQHQLEAVHHLSGAISGPLRYGVVGMPTGAGKTAIAVATARKAIEDGQCDHALLITPFTHAADGFRLTGTYILGERSLELDENAWLERAATGARDDQFTAWLSRPSDQALVTTHAQVVHGEGWIELLPPDCTGLLVVCDELHHGGEDATQVRDFLDAVHHRGGMVAGLSATLFRTDGRPLYPANVTPLVFSYTSLAAQGLFPTQIVLRLVPLGVSGTRLSRQHIADACAYLVDEGRVTICNIPPGASSETADRVVATLQEMGVEPSRILNAVGPDISKANAVRDALGAERSILKDPREGYGARSIDYVVSCQRFREAADLASCSHVASFGVTSSLQMAVQNIGRALRNKTCIAGYPEQWTDQSLYTLFVPQMERDDPARRQVARMLLQLSCLLEGSDAVMHFHRLWPDLVKGLRLPPVVRAAREPVIKAMLLGLTPEEEAEARELVAVETQRLTEALGRAPSVAEVMAAVQVVPVPPDQSSRASLQALLLAADERPELIDRVQQVVHNVLAEHAEDNDEFYSELLEALLALGQEYEHLVVDYDGRLLKGLQAVLSRTDIEQMASKMVRERDTWLPRDVWTDRYIVDQIILPYVHRWGHAPRVNHGPQDISTFVGSRCCLADIDDLLRTSAFSLDLLVIAQVHVRDVPVPEHQLARLAPSVKKRRYVLDARHWRDGPTLRRALNNHRMSPWGHNLVALDLAARRGWRGLPGGQSLFELLCT